jgi:hypothetical protein
MCAHLGFVSVSFLLSAFVTLGPASAAWTEPVFMGLGDLPGGGFCSGASGISADGSVVVGGDWPGCRSARTLALRNERSRSA